MGLFDVPTGGAGVALTSGSPDYQNAIVQNTERNLKPAYMAALQGQQQSMANRGLDNSGLAAAGEAGLNQSYLGQVANTATQAATGGADVTLQNQRIAQEQQLQRDLQAQQIQAQKDMEQQRINQENTAQWAQLAGGAAGGVGGLIGGSMFDALAKKANQGGSGGDPAASPYASSDPYGSMNKMDNTFASLGNYGG